MKRQARITLHPLALQHNLLQAKKAAPDSQVMAVIKANAYGHGAVAAAGILYPHTDAFAVACIAEAVELREAGIDLPIMVLQGPQNETDVGIAVHYRLRLVINDPLQLTYLESFSQIRPAQLEISLKIDSGMHRLGIIPHQATAVYQQLLNNKHINPQSLWLMTHLACADELENDYTRHQLDQFNAACQALQTNSVKAAKHPLSIANSAGILGWKQSHADWIRPGIMLYGSSPFADAQEDANGADKYDLQAAMTFDAPLIAVRSLKKGDTIGYGATWQCPSDTTVAVVACGYADGYPRHAASGTPVYINGRIAPLVGRVSMDMIVVDLNDIEAKPGDRAELWGKNLPVDRVAHQAETISYELLCNAGNLNQ